MVIIYTNIIILNNIHFYSVAGGGEEKHKLESNEIYVRVGSTEWNHGGLIYDADDLFRHPKYDSFGRKDIGILKLHVLLNIQFVCI
ncbi:unnamed protein product [Timema podura]|uniref:Uncharacterized protein n=1 Tax=Timema podura TaxID=61482 RepID=A0ABN7NZM8_TIMPD|nr:unnamed protein product [Timema podura]